MKNAKRQYLTHVGHLCSRWDVCKQQCYYKSKNLQLSFHIMSFCFSNVNWHFNYNKCLIQQKKALIILNHLRYWPFSFVCSTIAIKDFCYPSLACKIIRSNCVKTHSIRSKSQYEINKIEVYSNIEDKTAVVCNSFVIYDFSCPSCGDNFICKTERTWHERTV